MASEFQKRKLAGVFDAMDVDRDGYLEESDFEALAARWTGLRAWMQDSEEYESMRAAMLGWWHQILAASGRKREKRVTLDEMLSVVDEVGTATVKLRDAADAMFGALDENGDGQISEEEYNHVVTRWKGAAADTSGSFHKLDLNSDGIISRDEFAQHWHDFWTGDDESSPSQYVFGPL